MARHQRVCARALIGLCLSQGWVALAQSDTSLRLRPSERLAEHLSAQQRQSLPSFLRADHIEGQTDTQTVIRGGAMLRKGELVIQADTMRYDHSTDTAQAQGHVRINRSGNVYEGSQLQLRVDAFQGFFESPRYEFLRNQAHGQASRVDFLSDKKALIHNATFTTCKRQGGPNWMPDWMLSADALTMDNEVDEATAKGVLVRFKDVPILPLPYLSFPISDARKSGLLPPNIGLTNVNGFQYAQPYYWNIAPNRDLTITPTIMTKRGASLESDFRYLEPDATGRLRLNLMPTDRLRDRHRWNLNLAHQQALTPAWADSGLNLGLKVNRVSDDNYWRDFSAANLNFDPTLTPRLLSSQVQLGWSTSGFANSVLMQRWQTLQDANAPITPPYDRVPQLHTRYDLGDWRGLDVSLDADLTRFANRSPLMQQPDGERFYTLLQLSRPWRTPGGYVTPKIQLHATQYQLDAPFNGDSQVQRVVPTFSVDGALVFERATSLFGRALRQTLEPRAFFVRTPTRLQQHLPNYDSAAYDFNMATIYTENAFTGHDRISDGSQLTLGVTSRFLDPERGDEALRLMLAQRLRVQDSQVYLPQLPGLSNLAGTVAAQQGVSDVLLGSRIQWNPQWRFDANVQVSASSQQTQLSNLEGRYSPGRYQTVNLAYRFQRDLSEQLDLGWQWPMADWARWMNNSATSVAEEGRWYSVGRLNYSLRDRQFVNTLLGFEYDAGCWLGRVVMQRTQTSTVAATQSIMFQLEFVGFTRIGVNPLQSLRANIPNYQSLRPPAPLNSRFSHYD
jgi:LPS-assembly protein